eukprot:gene11320-2062_t
MASLADVGRHVDTIARDSVPRRAGYGRTPIEHGVPPPASCNHMRPRSMPSPAVPHVAIAGGGPAGLVMAGILSKTLGRRIRLEVLEYAAAPYDQGFGLGLNHIGVQALQQAGVHHRGWEMARPDSGTTRLYTLKSGRQGEPFAVFRNPRWMQTLIFNTHALCTGLLDELEERQVNLRYGCGVSQAQAVHDDLGTQALLLDAQGNKIGQYDLVIDACGVQSPLRGYPESAPKEILWRMERGTLSAVAQGYFLSVQRFGAGMADRRASVFYWIRPAGDAVRTEIARLASMDGATAHLTQLKEWLQRDMGTLFDPEYVELIGKMNHATVHPLYSHGLDTDLRSDPSLPLVCIGDSLLKVGGHGAGDSIGVGRGCNLAMQDAMDLAAVLSKPGTFAEMSGRLQHGVSGLAAAEDNMLQRKRKHLETWDNGRLIPITGPRPTDGTDPNVALKNYVQNNSQLYGRAPWLLAKMSCFFLNQYRIGPLCCAVVFFLWWFAVLRLFFTTSEEERNTSGSVADGHERNRRTVAPLFVSPDDTTLYTHRHFAAHVLRLAPPATSAEHSSKDPRDPRAKDKSSWREPHRKINQQQGSATKSRKQLVEGKPHKLVVDMPSYKPEPVIPERLKHIKVTGGQASSSDRQEPGVQSAGPSSGQSLIQSNTPEENPEDILQQCHERADAGLDVDVELCDKAMIQVFQLTALNAEDRQ